MLALIHDLSKCFLTERDTMLRQCNPVVRAILTQNDHVRHVPLQREIGFITQSPDWGAIPSLVSGLPMVGHAVWVPEMMIRSRPSSIIIDELVQKSKSNNYKMISQAVSTGDDKLDEMAWQKTKDECDRNIAFVTKSYHELVEQLGDDVVIAVRRAIWEMVMLVIGQ